jgi:large subunit ribosomal protein L21
MYAVIKTGGKQYRVSPGQVLKVESLAVEPGATVEFAEVLLVADGENLHIGAPHVPHGKVTAEVVRHGKHKKIHVIKFKRRKNYLRTQGHRQAFTEIKISGIQH